MSEVFILGAGFSRAIASTMPTTDGLGTTSIEVLRSIHRALPRIHSEICDGLSCDYPLLVDGRYPSGSFEVWLSRLVEAQPYRYEHENARALSLYYQLADMVGDRVLNATNETCSWVADHNPEWLGPLIRSWHATQADVITFNYDTLVEACFESLQLTVGPLPSSSLGYRALGPTRLPQAGVLDGGGAGPSGPSFRYMKLHGSIHWYWDPVTRTADSMVDVGMPARWGHGANTHSWRPSEDVPGRRPVIVPPTTSKATFFNNPLLRNLWRKAFDSVRAADHVTVIGYSLPQHDLLVGAMLEDAARERGGIDATVVDLTPAPVIERLESYGYAVRNQFSDIVDFLAGQT